jgi:phosphoglycolate phosphatase-like HAD superfamily hydrolase
MANNAGAKSVAALWGLQSKERLAAYNPTVMLEDISELPPAIDRIFHT